MRGKRILALDHGTKRIGIALSDELGWTAQPLETYQRRTLEADLRHIDRLVQDHEVAEIVIGLPLRLNGERGPAAHAVQEFVARLEQVVKVPIITWDERMTTRSAEDLLIAADVSRKKRKGVVDRIAAAILLQSYLENRSRPEPSIAGEESAGADESETSVEDLDEDTIDPVAPGSSMPPCRDGLSGPSMGSAPRC